MLRSWSLIGATLLAAACSSGSGGADGGAGGSASAGSGGTGGAAAGTGGASAGVGGDGVGGSTGGTGGSTGGTGGAGAANAGTGGAAGRGGSGGTTGTGGGAAGASGQATVYVGGSSATIAILSLDLATGSLTMRSEAPGGTSPTYLAWDGAQRFLYAGNGGQGRVTSYTIGAADALARLGDVSTAGMGYMASVTHLSVHPTGNWVLTAHFDSGHVAVLPVATNGLAGAPVDIEHPATEAHQIVSDASGRHVFVPCRSGNVIAQYGFDSATGQLTAATPALVQADTGAGPRHIAFHPNQQSAYVINELNGTITSYRYDATAGLLSMPQSISAAPAGMTERSSAHVVVHPSGKFVYASNRTTNTIGMFSVDASSGRLTPIGHETGGGMVRTPRDFGMEPGGRFLIVANQGTNTVVVFRIDATAGTLTRVGDPLTVPASPQFAGALAAP